MEIRESQIESVLVSAPLLTKNLLQLEDEPRLLVRQMILASGRLDLLYAHKTNLLLVELKVVPFHARFVRQVLQYRIDLINLQTSGKLVRGDVLPYLLCPSASDEHKSFAAKNGVVCADY